MAGFISKYKKKLIEQAFENWCFTGFFEKNQTFLQKNIDF